jgi:hypothetical protein
LSRGSGGAIRKSPEKKVGTIVLPVFVSVDDDPDAALDDSAFRHVWDVLKALRAHDEALGEELDELRRDRGARRSAPRRPGKIKLDVPAGRVGAEFVRAFNARLVEQTTASWEFYFGLLERFVEREGNALVPVSYTTDDGFRLGAWVNKQRTAFGAGRLDDDRTKRLAELPGWTWNVLDDSWDQGVARLERYVASEGDSRVPKDYRDDDGYGLGIWVHTQRRARASDRLSRARRRLLEAIPGWTWNTRKAQWEKGYGRLKRFLKLEGHPPDGSYRDEDGYRLGHWVNNQRAAHRRGQLSEERAQLLESLPAWAWEMREASWEAGYDRLVRFAKREGHSRVPQSYQDADGYRLGAWVHIQRGLRREGELSEERVHKLEALPGWVWDPREARWELGYARLLGFVEQEGHSRVLTSYRDDDGYRLGNWVGSQRSARARGELSEERVKLLEALPGWVWDANDAMWEDGYIRLLEFVEDNGHARVPNVYRDGDGARLGVWVGHQRAFRRRGQLSDERISRLEAVPSWTWDAREAGARGKSE